MFATSSTVANRFEQRGRPGGLEELGLDHRAVHAPLPRQVGHERRHALRFGRAGQHRVDRDAGPGDRLGDASGDGELGGLGHAVVDHLGGDLHGRLAGDEDDAAPVLPSIPGR